MAILRNDTVVKSADGQHSSAIITAANIGSHSIAPNSTYYIGTTQNIFNRASGAQTLTGVSIDGNAATVTNGVYTTGTQTIGGAKTFSDGITVNTATYNRFTKPSPSTYQTVALFGSTSGGLFLTTDNPIIGVGAYYNTSWIATATSGRQIDFAGGNFTFGAFSGATVGGAASWGTVAQLSSAGVFSATGDFRAPIFYDRNNTSYYLDPANTGISLLVAGKVGIGTTSPTYKLQIGTVGSLDDSIRIGTYQVAKNTRQYIGNTRDDSGLFESVGNGDTPSTVLGGVAGIRIVNTEGTLYAPQADNSVQLLTHIYNGGSRVALHANYNGNVGIGTTSPAYKLDVSGTGFASGDFRAPIFYDSNDTAYYVDPNSVSRLASLRVYSAFDTASSDVYANMRVMRNNATTDGMYIGYGNSGSTSALTRIFGGGATTGELSKYSNYTLEPGSFRSPIFYDSDNTSYYIDAASTSNLVGLTVANTITGSISGNAATATILQTARNINGTSFNGSAAITTATWGTARTLTIGSTGKSVDGSAGVSWSLAEIGAAATNQTMFIGTTSVAINRASASQTLTGVSIDGNAANITAYTVNQNVGTGNSPSFVRLTSTQSTGTSPFVVSSTTVVNNLNSDLLDGQHGSYYQDPANLALQTSWTIPIQTANSVAGFLYGTFGDALAFRTISNLQYWDGSAWQAYSNPNIQNILTGNIQGSSATVTPTNRKFRFEFTAPGAYLGGGVLVVHQTWNIGAHQVSSMLEYYNGTSWITAITERSSGSGEGNYHFYNRGDIHGDWTQYRITITSVDTVNSTTYTSIQLLYDYTRSGLPNNFLPITWDYAKNVTTTGSLRTPIFYDSNNTAYYIDAASTSRLNTINVGASGVVINNASTAAERNLKIKATGSNPGVGIALYDSSDNFRVQLYGEASNYGFLDGLWAGWDLRKTIDGNLYLNNSTTYYLNTVSTSALYDLTLIGAKHTYLYINPGNGYEAMVRYNGGSGSGWYVGKRITSQLVGTESFHFYSEAAGATVGGIDTSGSLFSTGSMRSPIFYDQNNTAYYCDPASTSVFNAFTGSHSGGSVNVTSVNGAYLGVNNTTNTNGYGISLYNGASAGEPTYGLMFQGTGTFGTHGSVTGDWATYFTMNNDNTRGWIFRKTGGGGNTASISAGGIITASSDVRAPIFYDSNNTAYYLDPASTSNLNALTVAGGNATIYRDLIVNGGASGNFGNRIIVQGTATTYTLQDTNVRPTVYLTGAYPVITLNHTVTGNTNHGPTIQFTFNGLTTGGSTSRQILIGTSGDGNCLDFGFSGGGYGGNPDYNPHNGIAGYSGVTPMRLFSNGLLLGSTGAYPNNIKSTSFALDVRGTGSSSTDFRAPIFYDTGNTAYYCDPAGSSNFSTLSLAGTLQFAGNINWNHGVTAELGRKTLGFNIWQGGKKLNADEDFNNGTNGITLYNNSGGTALTITRTALATAPNSSGQVLRVAYTPGSNGTSPGFGGFFFATQTAANKVFITRFVASIPTGRSLDFHSNGYGTNSNAYWLTNNVGTGKWEEYVFVVMCGNTGTLSSTNFFAISGGANTAFSWDIASATVFDITNKYEMVSRVLTADLAVSSPVYYDSNNTAYYIDAASTSVLNALTVGGEPVLTQANITFTPNGVGWYRILTAGGISSGTIRISGFYDNRSATIEFDYTVNGWGNQCYVTVRNNNNYSVGLITQIRVSNDGGASANSYLDIYIASSTTPAALTISNFGPIKGTLVSSPVVGAVAGTSNIKTVNISNIMGLVTTGVVNGSAATFSGSVTSTYGNFASPGLIMGDAQYGFYVVSGNVYYKSASGGVHYWRNIANSANTMSLDNSGILTVSGNVSAPIFYDSNDTTYYTNPSSLSNILELKTNKTWYDSSATVWGGGINMGGNNPSIGFQSTASTWWYMLHHSSSNINFYRRSTSGSWSQDAIWDNGGNLIWKVASVRAPIFYDQNDTTYYIDAASTSIINILQFPPNTAQILGNTSSSYGSIDIRGARNGYRGIHFNGGGNTPHLMFDGSANGGVYYETGSRWASFYSYAANCWGFGGSTTNSAYNVYAPTGVYSGGRVDGTIFYDSNNTAYYIDGASTSNLYGLNIVDGNLELYKSQTVDMSNTTTYSTSNYYPVTIVVPTEGCIIQIQNNLNSNVPSWSTHAAGFTLNLKWRTNGSGWGTTQVRRYIEQYFEQFTNQTICGGITQMSNSSIEVVWLRGGGRYYFKFSRNLSATAQAVAYTINSQSVSPTSTAQNTIWNSYSGGWTLYNDTTYSTSNMYTPVLYDYNNSAYYVDPASTSNLVGLTVANTITGSVSGNSGTVGGLSVHSGRNNEVNKIVRTDSNGYIQAGWINTTSGDNGTTAIDRVYASSDGYIRYYTPTNFRTVLDVPTRGGSGASGSWGISVTGSSASCTGNAATVTNGVYTNTNNTLTSGVTTIYNTSNTLINNLSGNLGLTMFQATAGTDAYMTFHIGSDYAAYFGLGGAENDLVYGGWSAGNNRRRILHSGNAAYAWNMNQYVRTTDNVTHNIVDATQFRDSSNTAYYLDPASTSILNLVRTRNTFGERIALNSASPQTINTHYNVTELTLTSSISTLTFSNIQASGIVHMWTLVTVGNATVYTITWPAAVKWPGGTAPTLTTTSGKRDIYQFVTYDGGTNIYAIIVGQNL